MNIITKLLKRIWAAWFIVVFGSFLILLFPIFWLFLKNESTYPLANILRRWWAYYIVFLTGVNYETILEEDLDKNKQYIFCPNHSSVLDIPYFAILWNNYFKFMAKIEFTKIIFFGHFFKTIDIAVDRNNKISSYKAYKKALESIDKGYSMIIFPEGTSQRTPPQLIDFKNGPFKIAIDKQIPIVPVTFLDNWHLFHWHGDFSGNPGTSRVVIHKPIETQGMTDVDVEQLKNSTYNIINETLLKEYGSKQTISR